MRPLEGIKVIELSQVISAPSAGKVLLEMGAEVIKVETSDRGDGWRYTPAVYSAPVKIDESPIFESLNAGKKFVKLSLKDPEGVKKMQALISKADVFLTNFRGKALHGMGIGYEDMKKLNPRLIYATVTGYGDEGPKKDDPGFDNTCYWAETGFMRDFCLLGADGTSLPTNAPVGGGDTVVGGWIAGGICAALYEREKTGVGTYVTVPLFGAGIWAFSQVSIGTQYGYVWPRSYYQMPPTNNPYQTADGDWIMTSMEKYDEQWPKFCYAFGADELKEHPIFSKRANTVDLMNRKACVEAIEAHAKLCHTADIVDRLKEVDLVFCVMPHMADVYTNEQAIANKNIVPYTYNSGKSVYIPKPPVRFEGYEPLPHTTCPGVGADTEEVFKEFGIE